MYPTKPQSNVVWQAIQQLCSHAACDRGDNPGYQGTNLQEVSAPFKPCALSPCSTTVHDIIR